MGFADNLAYACLDGLIYPRLSSSLIWSETRNWRARLSSSTTSADVIATGVPRGDRPNEYLGTDRGRARSENRGIEARATRPLLGNQKRRASYIRAKSLIDTLRNMTTIIIPQRGANPGVTTIAIPIVVKPNVTTSSCHGRAQSSRKGHCQPAAFPASFRSSPPQPRLPADFAIRWRV